MMGKKIVDGGGSVGGRTVSWVAVAVRRGAARALPGSSEREECAELGFASPRLALTPARGIATARNVKIKKMFKK
jgi:hypothetical protein